MHRTFTVVFALFLAGCAASAKHEARWQSLFNGKDLSGWEGDLKYWSVKDGCIVGDTTKGPALPQTTFLIWRGGEVSNFEMAFKASFEGNNNSGVQYRSREIAPFTVMGYQCDIGTGGARWYGKLTEERGRRWLAQAGQSVVIDAGGKIEVTGQLGEAKTIQRGIQPGEWVDVRIVARGNHLLHQINGITVAEAYDNDRRAMKSGIVALQLHKGERFVVRYKNLRLRQR